MFQEKKLQYFLDTIEYLNKKGVKNTMIYTRMELSPASFSNLINGRALINDKHIDALIEAFEEIPEPNIVWPSSDHNDDGSRIAKLYHEMKIMQNKFEEFEEKYATKNTD